MWHIFFICAVETLSYCHIVALFWDIWVTGYIGNVRILTDSMAVAVSTREVKVCQKIPVTAPQSSKYPYQRENLGPQI